MPEAPVIDTQRTFAYDQIFLCWRLPPHSPPAWHYTIEFRRTDVPAQPGPTRWQRREEVRGTSALLENPDTGSVYVLRVRGCNKAGYGEYSEDVHLHTPPAPGERRPAGHSAAFGARRVRGDPLRPPTAGETAQRAARQLWGWTTWVQTPALPLASCGFGQAICPL